MTGRLLDRQVRLIEYLTSGGAIFGSKRNGPLDPSLQGINRSRLDIEARFSFEKRMEKIAAVFPLTLGLLDAHKEAVMGEFVDACPPLDISRIENARQFHGFLSKRHKRAPHLQDYLPDVAACELACAVARAQTNSTSSPDVVPPDTTGSAIRRNPGVVLLRTAFDIRAIFEGASSHEPVERETLLAIATNAGEPQIFELTAETFHLLAALDQWIALDDMPDGLVADLAKANLLEVRH